jgi:hypothetical protein
MPLDTRIALTGQPLQLESPLAQYSQLMGVVNAGTQNQLAQMQMQENQQMAPLRMQEAQNRAASSKLTLDRAVQAQDFIAKTMDAAEKNSNGTAPKDPLSVIKAMLGHPNKEVQDVGTHMANAYQLIQDFEADQRYDAAKRGGVAPIGDAAPMVAPAAAAAPVNALAPAVAAPVNAMVAPTAQSIKAEIDSGDLQFGRSKRWAKERDLLVDQFKELAKSPLAKIDPKDYTPDSFAAYMQTGDASKLLKAKDERLAFDQTKFEWEKANPGKTIKEVVQNGVIKYFAINDRTGESAPVTIAGGKILTGTDMASQRLAFDQAKFAWEKANPGFTIQQAEDGSIVGVNNRTLQAYPVTLNAGTPPPPAPFTGVGGATPSAGGGRGAVGVTDNRVMPGSPAAAPAGAPTVGMPLKGKAAGLTESQGNATAFGMRMKDSHAVLKDLENKGVSNTGVIGGTTGAVVGLVPLIGDKLTSGVDNIYNVLPEVLGGYSPEQQQVLNGRINFISAVLRKESGASIQPSEFSMMEKLYFPRPGDLPAVIKQKQDARELAIKAMKVQAGPGAKSIENLGVGTSSESDPLGIRK